MTDVKKGDTVVLAGTRKGLFILKSRDRKRWRVEKPQFQGVDVHRAFLDPRDSRTIYAAVTSYHWGATVQRSTSFGARWQKSAPAFPKGAGLSVDRVWQVAPGAGESDVWAGVEPAGLFHSEDRGRTWRSVDGLNLRSDRSTWMPGGGGLCLHTILPHPREPERVTVAISAVGILETTDAGEKWRVMNGAIRNEMLPSKATREDELGTCPHKLVRDPTDPDTLYMQNHWGVYRRSGGEPAWTDITKGLPSRFGFPMAAHPTKRGTVYVVPLEGDFNRVAKDGAFAVHRTRDGGKNWTRLAKGLPQKNAWLTVLREGLATDGKDPAGVYVGTTTGQLYASRDEGASWAPIAEGLPPILSVSAGVAG